MSVVNNIELARATFKTLCKALETNDWKFKSDVEGMSVFCCACGEDLPIDINIKVDAERMLVWLASKMPYEIQKDKLIEIALAVSVINNSLVDGSFDFDIVFSDMKDKDGNNIDVEIEKNWIPLNTHTVDEAPDIPAFDMENSLTYGMLHIGSMYDRTADTELAYPMTVGEFIDSVDCGTGYGIVTDNDGKVLDRDDYVPTGAQFRQCYDNALFFTSTLTVIGDVNSDGKVTAADARIILRHSAGIDYIKDSYQRNAANTCQSTEITARDARSVMRYAASIEDCYTEWYRYHCLLNKYSRGLYNTNL